MPALENVALWHERDISHSSVERYIGPDATVTLDFALARMAGIVGKLVVYPERMKANLEKTPDWCTASACCWRWRRRIGARGCLPLVQRQAMRAWNGDGTLLDLLKADEEISRALSAVELESLFDLAYHFKQVDTIFARVFVD